MECRYADGHVRVYHNGAYNNYQGTPDASIISAEPGESNIKGIDFVNLIMNGGLNQYPQTGLAMKYRLIANY